MSCKKQVPNTKEPKKKIDFEDTLLKYCQAVAEQDNHTRERILGTIIEAAKDTHRLHTMAGASKSLRGKMELSEVELSALDEVFYLPEVSKALDLYKGKSDAIASAWIRYCYRPTPEANSAVHANLTPEIESSQNVSPDDPIATLEAEVASLQRMLDEVERDAAVQRSEAEREISDLLKQLEAAQDELERLETAALRAEALAADYAAEKRKVRRLENERENIERRISNEKLARVLVRASSAINDLEMYPEMLRKGALDTDALVGFSMALDSLIDAFVQEGAELIGIPGEITAFDPACHVCPTPVGSGDDVVIRSVGFAVGGKTVIPAQVNTKEDN